MAISLTPKSGKTVVGVVEMKGNTSIDNVAKVVTITNPQVTGTYFPSLDKLPRNGGSPVFKTFVPSTSQFLCISLIASTPKKEAPAGAQFEQRSAENFCGLRPSILLSVNGEPVLSEVPNTSRSLL